MTANHPALSPAQIYRFIEDGFVRLDDAFPQTLAAEARDILWAETGCNPDDPATWTKPVIRLGQFGQKPFREAANTPVLHQAFDQLVGKGRWQPRLALGTFPIRFPSDLPPGDDGWHVDMSLDYDKPDFMDWRITLMSEGRALMLLFLFSDVGEDDAPTRIRIGSHRDIARQLTPAGELGLTLRQLAANGFAETAHCREAVAVGPAGTVYLCHPFLVHAAQKHRGTTPKFMAQPCLLPNGEMSLSPKDRELSPVEQAIAAALKA